MITKKKKAFTLIELLVAVGILAMVLVFASTIFRVSIDAYRTATAQAEIMQKFRALTDQLNADFAGLRKDAPLLVQFDLRTLPEPFRYDQMMFFADGDFQSVQSYNDNNNDGVPDPAGDIFVRGNLARVHYGQAQVNTLLPWQLENESRTLAIRRHILTADARLDDWPETGTGSIAESFDDIDGPTGQRKNELYEHDNLPLSRWKTIDGDIYAANDSIVDICFGFRPQVQLNDPRTFHKLMCQGLSSFSIQWAYWDNKDDRYYWFPSDDPDGIPGTNDSHFNILANQFGVLFNIPNSSRFTSNVDLCPWYPIDDAVFTGNDFALYPKAIKFTFKIHDSKGIIADGQEFTHIVYLDE